MTEEREHYMDYLLPSTSLDPLKVHKSPTTSLDPEPNKQNKHTTRPGLVRAVTTAYFAGAEYIARLLLAPGP
jgi:hypothetical protein